MARSASATRPGQPNGEGHDGIVATGTEACACATPKTKDKIKASTRYCETQNGKKESGFEEGKSSEKEVSTEHVVRWPRPSLETANVSQLLQGLAVSHFWGMLH